MRPLRWLFKRMLLVMAAVMIGVSNVIYEDDRLLNDSRYQTEQPDGPGDGLPQ